MNKTAKRYSNIATLAIAVQAALHIVFSMAISSLPADTLWLKYAMLALSVLFMNLLPAALVHFIAGKPGREELRLTGLVEKPKRSDKLAVTASCAALVFAFGLLYEKVFPTAASDIPVSVDTPLYMHAIFIISLCVLPAVCEEIFFRKIIASRLAVAGKISAVIVSSLMFGLAHFSGAMFPYAFFAGILLGSVYFRTGSVKYPIAAHFFCNLTSYLFAFVKQVMTQSAYSTLEIVTIAAFFAAALLLSFVDARGMSDAFKRTDEHADAGSVVTPAFMVYCVCATLLILLWVKNG